MREINAMIRREEESSIFEAERHAKLEDIERNRVLKEELKLEKKRRD